MKPPVENVDLYLEAIESDDSRDALIRLRDIIRNEIPEPEECISYGMPMYKFHGMVAGMAAFKNHCSFYPGATIQDFKEELKGYSISKGTIRFQPDSPLPKFNLADRQIPICDHDCFTECQDRVAHIRIGSAVDDDARARRTACGPRIRPESSGQAEHSARRISKDALADRAGEANVAV